MADHDRRLTSDAEREEARRADQLAAECIDQVVKRPAARTAPTPTRRPVGAIIALAAVAVILVQVPSIRAGLREVPSIRFGVQETDQATDACIDMLWEVASLMQEDELPDDLARQGFVEPTTKRPYIVQDVDGATVVRCPNPDLHHLRALQITEAWPAPEAVR